jgi:hypothetical protein
MDPLSAEQATPIELNYAAAQEHAPRVERNRRLWLTHLPRILVKVFSYGINQEVEFLP